MAEHIPMAEPLPVAEALPYTEDAVPWDDDTNADEEDDIQWDEADERWGIGIGIGVGLGGAIVVTELVRGGPAERSSQVPTRHAARARGRRRPEPGPAD